MISPAPPTPRARPWVRVAFLATAAVLWMYVVAMAVAPAPIAQISLAPALAASDGEGSVRLSTPETGYSAIGFVGGDGGFGSSGGGIAVPMASITKTITALVVLDERPIAIDEDGPDILMTIDDARYLDDVIAVGGSWAPVVPGEVLTERQVLEVMLLESAGNYSVSLVTWAFGSVEAYVEEAEDWLSEHGLSDTRVVDPTGLDPTDRSTTSDLLALASMVMADPVLSEIVGTAADLLPSAGEIQNTNRALGHLGIDGIKTGTTDEAGWCLLFSARFTPPGGTPADLVGVILGAPDGEALYSSVTRLLDSARDGVRPIVLTDARIPVARLTTQWGASADVVSPPRSITAWTGTAARASVDARPVRFGVRGDEVGTLSFDLEGIAPPRQVSSAPLVLASDLPGPDLWWRLTHPLELLGG